MSAAGRRAVPQGIRITRVGLWYVLLTLVVAVPAANTGNNALYLVLATLLGLLAVSGLVSRQNIRRLELELTPPAEAYAGRPFALELELTNRGRWLGRRLLVVSCPGQSRPALVPWLGPGERHGAAFEISAERRGWLRIPGVEVASIFPLGLFRKGLRYPAGLEVLVYPEIGDPPRRRWLSMHGLDERRPSRVAGRGHELLGLRSFRPGDDRRGIHWKQSARTGKLIYMEREAERGQRLSVVLDNGVGELRDEAEREEFEQLVSQAATAAHHYLRRGYEVGLVTRDGRLPFGRGTAHRRRILELLALVQPVPAAAEPLGGRDPGALRLEMGRAAPPAPGVPWGHRREAAPERVAGGGSE